LCLLKGFLQAITKRTYSCLPSRAPHTFQEH
jgi:hypothetical protein